MPLDDVICGAFNAQYAPYSANSFTYASLGDLTNDGIEEIEPQSGYPFTSGMFGDTVLDGVTGGSSEMILEFVLQNVNITQVRRLVRPWYIDTNATTPMVQNTNGTNALEGAVTPAGLKWSGIAGRLALTPVAGTSADYGDSASHIRYYKHVVLMNGSEIRKKFWYRERYLPIRLRVLPWLDSDSILRFWQYVSSAP